MMNSSVAQRGGGIAAAAAAAGERRRRNDDVGGSDGDDGDNNNNNNNNMMMMWSRFGQRWRNLRGSAAALLLLSCSFSYLIASSLIDNFIIDDYDDATNYVHIGGYNDNENGNNHRRSMMETTASSSSSPRQSLMAVPLLPHHELHHRKRRELSERRPGSIAGGGRRQAGEEEETGATQQLQLRQEEEYTRHFESNNRRRTREYDIHSENANIDNDRRLQLQTPSHPHYETGPLYQGYGTHYIDLYVGSPIPKRRTVVVDTGSRSTAFPCSGNNYVEGGCEGCGMINNGAEEGEENEVDDDGEYIAANSVTYVEKACQRNGGKRGILSCDFGACVPSSSAIGRRLQGEPGQSSNKDESITSNGAGGNKRFQCRMSASYAEGSMWSAIEASDVVYPFGPPHTTATNNDANDGTFRLKFGCQTKVTGLFQYQLEDGILGMDHRDGSFWIQLREFLESVAADDSEAKDNGNDGNQSEQFFDPSQFSLCYGRQPLSSSLPTATIRSGALTLGGTDHLLHLTPMVYAMNVTPLGGWYAVRIKAIFLRTSDNDDVNASSQGDSRQYVRVQADEAALNGSPNDDKGVIVDSGTTDTYLPLALAQSFQVAWEQILGEAEVGEGAKYDNNPRYMTPEEVNSLPTILVVLRGHEPSNSDVKSGDASVGMASSHAEMFTQPEPNDNNSSSTLSRISGTDVVVAIPPSHYMEESIVHPGRYAARFYFTERAGAQSILGSNFIMGHDVHFDNGQGNRIGFAESDCDYSKYLEKKDAV